MSEEQDYQELEDEATKNFRISLALHIIASPSYDIITEEEANNYLELLGISQLDQDTMLENCMAVISFLDSYSKLTDQLKKYDNRLGIFNLPYLPPRTPDEPNGNK